MIIVFNTLCVMQLNETEIKIIVAS